MAMTQRERYLAMGVGVVVGLFGVQYVVNSIRNSLQQKQDLVDAARAESDDMNRIATSGTIAARKLDQLRVKSLPTNPEALVAQYKSWLTRCAEEAGITDIVINSPERATFANSAITRKDKKQPPYTAYKFSLTGACSTEQWLDFLARYYDTDYLHSIQNLKVTMTKEPNWISISLDSTAISLKGADSNQKPTGKSSGRLAMSADEYKKSILSRNPFSPPNNPPSLAFTNDDEAAFAKVYRGSLFERTLKPSDYENHNVTLEIVDQAPEGLRLNGKTLSWTPKENGEYTFVIRATDSGLPHASKEEKIVLTVVDPPKPEEPTPPPPKFDVATQAFVSALLSGRAGPEAWIRSRTEGKTVALLEGSDFEIGSVKAKVVGINLNEDLVELESDGVRWTIGMDTSLADAFAKGKIN